MCVVTAAAEGEISCSTGVISAGDHPVKVRTLALTLAYRYVCIYLTNFVPFVLLQNLENNVPSYIPLNDNIV